ncbi:hypothetical protein JXR93_06795, partial [bacterium]|nr:hypothetical protein [bacterium]
MKKIIFITLSLLSISCSQRKLENNNNMKKTVSNNIQLTQNQKLEDFDYLFDIIQENYPFLELNKRVNGIDWISNKEKYRKLIVETKNDDQYKEVIDKIMLDLNNGHTH